jgi:hypothetical protein
VVEAALRRALGFDLFERKENMGEEAAMALAIEAQRWARRRRG